MSNPYRASRGRIRGDHSTGLGYGTHNQNSWNSIHTDQPNINTSNLNEAWDNNAWNWGTDTNNGSTAAGGSRNNVNDSWNWNVDQQADIQQQQNFVPTYPNQGQTSNEQYYKNINGNNKSEMSVPHATLGANIPLMNANSESNPNYSDPYASYGNYVQTQQSPPPPRPSSVKSTSSGLAEQTNWSNEQQSQHFYYMQQRPPLNQVEQSLKSSVPTPNCIWTKSDQQSDLQPTKWKSYSNQQTDETSNEWSHQSAHSQIPQIPCPPKDSINKDHSLSVNQIKQHAQVPLSPQPYMWNKADQQSALQQSKWKSYSNQQINEAGNEVQHQSNQSQMPQKFCPPKKTFNEEHSSEWTQENQPNEGVYWQHQEQNVQNQWSKNNHENKSAGQIPSLAQVNKSHSEVNLWQQQSANVSKDLQQKNSLVDPTQWQQQLRRDSNFSDENTGGRQPQNATGFHYSLPSEAPKSESNTSLVGSTEQHIEAKHDNSNLPYTDSTKLSELSQAHDHHDWTPKPETVLATRGAESKVIQDDNYDFNIETERHLTGVSEIATEISQISLENTSSKEIANQSIEPRALGSIEGRNQHGASNFHAQTVNTSSNVNLKSSDNVSGTDPSHSIENKIPNQEPVISNIYQHITTASVDNASGYDQWYNRNALPIQQEGAWYSQDRAQPAKQLTPEQNVENYEIIQQTSDFVNLEVVAPTLQERDVYGSRDSINKETLGNDPKPSINSKEAVRDYKQEASNVEVPSLQQLNLRAQPPLLSEQMPDNYEFASNDRNTFLETGELTDSHQDHESIPPSQDDENDEVPNDIPFLREVPGQSSSMVPRRNDPTGQEQYIQGTQRLPDPRRNDPSGQEHGPQIRSLPERAERRDVPSGQERNLSLAPRGDSENVERRNDPSGRERSLPPQQSRNDPSGEERIGLQSQIMLDSSDTREVPGRGYEIQEPIAQADGNLRRVPRGVSPSDILQPLDDRSTNRVVTGSQEMSSVASMAMQEQLSDGMNKREEAVGASMGEPQGLPGLPARDSYENEDDDRSAISRDDSRERHRDSSSERRRYEYDRKGSYYDREREYDDDYYYYRRRGDTERSYPRDDYDRRDLSSYREDDRKHHSRDDLDRHSRDDLDRRSRGKDEADERDARRRPDDRKRERVDDRRRERDPRDTREYDPRYPRDHRDPRDYLDRDRRREDRRLRKFDDYERDSYRREYYDDPYSKSSRPSSRSSYNDRDREYYMRSRDPYYGYNGYNSYDYAHYGNNYYAYLENLRRTNPAAYSEWYHKYYAPQHQQQHVARPVGNYPEDRASVHSGRSSCDDRTTSDKRALGDLSLNEDSTIASARMTPTKFSTSHAFGCFSIGSLLHVHPSYPADGERAKVDIFRIDTLLGNDSIAKELRAYPGPLIKQVGVTHKKTIIEYCENKIKKAALNEEITERASYILLYELMIMLIQQNGNVVGVDIATLLLRNKEAYPFGQNKSKLSQSERRESVISQRSSAAGSEGNGHETTPPTEKIEATKQKKSVEELTNEFRNTLLYGLVQEALEYAMNEGLWGHALFLASKLEKRTHASVMARFANSLSLHDPLQTLYQLHSGRIPAIVSNVKDPASDDWRPHLAMIISNTSSNPEINRRSIMTLGDTLYAKGDIYAAHFCYILAQLDFGKFGDNGVKLVLIGSNHHKPYSEFFTTEAVMLTEIYEYARNLSEPGFTLVDLQSFKFDLALRMIDYGLVEKALLYIEQIAINIVNEPSKYKRPFINAVYVMGDRIKYHDPVCKDAVEDVGNLIWLNNLAEIVDKCQTGEIFEDEACNSQVILAEQQNYINKQQTQQEPWNIHQPEYRNEPTSMLEVPSTDMQTEWQPLSLPTNIQETHDQSSQYIRNDETTQYSQAQQDYWSQQSYYQPNYGNTSNWQQQSIQAQVEQTDVDGSQQQEKWNYEQMQPTISMTPSLGKQYDPLEELDALETSKTPKPASEAKKTPDKTTENKLSNSGSSWFGGLFSKLALKPKNQMILPDDSNPAIVWDPVAKKWMNKDEDGDNASGSLAPPPKATDMAYRSSSIEQLPSMHQQMVQGSTPYEDTAASINSTKIVTGSNMFKLQKGRSMRANYVDVMKTNGVTNSVTTTALTTIPTPATSPALPMATSSPQLFVPAPVNDPSAPLDFLTLGPTSAPVDSENQGFSRWSSTSSLSREVQSYTMRDQCLLQRNKGPMVFNPADVKNRPRNLSHNKYPPR
ncbi:uncharacterized protein [Prorops nasuta]|uniref:uncharacterized protein isoform X3 n=1 Tax=Prorops nasuta TaxID=863751 RepID=UPI0034CD9968